MNRCLVTSFCSPEGVDFFFTKKYIKNNWRLDMKRYNPGEIEPKWQGIWEENGTFRGEDFSEKRKFYATQMFPYPSGAGLHVGHVRNFTIVDAIARFHRQLRENVINPLGFDTFGLPAENYAIKTGVSPAVATAENIANWVWDQIEEEVSRPNCWLSLVEVWETRTSCVSLSAEDRARMK